MRPIATFSGNKHNEVNTHTKKEVANMEQNRPTSIDQSQTTCLHPKINMIQIFPKTKNSHQSIFWTLLTLLILIGSTMEGVGQSFITWGTPSGTTPPTITGTYTGGTVTVSQGGTGANFTFPNTPNATNMNGATGNQLFKTFGPTNTASKNLTFTFSSPVIINEFSIGDINKGGTFNDSFTFSGLTFTSVTGANVTLTTTGATATSESFVENTDWGRWTTSTASVTSFSINYALTGGLTHAALSYAMKVTAACNAGNTTPSLSATTITNICPATTVNLTTITASNTPANTELTWHTATPATTANKIATADLVNRPAGTYFAAFFDAAANCYSGTGGNGAATTSVTATLDPDCTQVGTPTTLETAVGTTILGKLPIITGGIGAFTYSTVTTSDTGCVAPSGFTAFTGTINNLNTATGEHTITAPSDPGNYFYCIKVCGSDGKCTVSIHKVMVTSVCPAGSTAPTFN